MRAAGPHGQCFRRALKWKTEVSTIYNMLDENWKLKMRQEYAIQKDWAFVEEKRTRTLTISNESEDEWHFLNWVNLCNKFGGFQFNEARDEALVCANYCEEIGGQMIDKDPITGSIKYLYHNKVFRVRNKEEWQKIVTAGTTENKWQAIAEESNMVQK